VGPAFLIGGAFRSTRCILNRLFTLIPKIEGDGAGAKNGFTKL
jgi:hypothetical protein